MKGKVKSICWHRSLEGAQCQRVIQNQTKDKKVWALGDYSVVFNLTQGVTSVMIMRGDLTIDPSPCLTSPAHFHEPFWMYARIFSYNVCIMMSHVDTLCVQGCMIYGIIWVVVTGNTQTFSCLWIVEGNQNTPRTTHTVSWTWKLYLESS